MQNSDFLNTTALYGLLRQTGCSNHMERKPAVRPSIPPSLLTSDTSSPKLTVAVAPDSYAVAMSDQMLVKWCEYLLPPSCLSLLFFYSLYSLPLHGKA